MDKIQAGKYVELVYEIFVVNGDQQVSVFKFKPEHPDAFVFGLDLSLIEGFQNHIIDLEQGEKFDFTLKPEEAFGVKNPDLVYELEKEIFHVDGKFDHEHIRVGAIVPMMTQEGMRVEGIVTQITDDKVTMDFNHQLAGKTLNFDVEVVSVRDATKKELDEGLHGEYLPLEEEEHHCCHGKGNCHKHEGDGECCHKHEGDGECCHDGDCHKDAE